MCQVINFKQYGSVAALNRAFGDRWVYIGRANSYAGLPQSPLANPFKAKDFGGRGQTLPHYKRWLWQRIQAGDETILGALKAIDAQTVLVCWCVPGPCHGEVVKAAAAWVQAQACHLDKLGAGSERSERRPRHRYGSFAIQGGFANHSAKDTAMTAVSDYDIAWVRPGKEMSGTARNLARRR